MEATSLSLLKRVQDPAADTSQNESWKRLRQIYAPFIERQIRNYRASLAAYGEDVVQEVLVVVMNHISEFERVRDGSFRSWLKTIAIHRIRNIARKTQREVAMNEDLHQWLDQLTDPHSAVSAVWNREHDEFVLQGVLESVQNKVQEKTWRIFEAHVLHGVDVAQVAETFAVSEADVYSAKSRLLRMARQEAAGLLDND